MEFSFRKEYITGEYTINMSMGHEAFSVWLEQEGTDFDWLHDLQSILRSISEQQIRESKITGRGFVLYLTTEEAKVINNSLLAGDDAAVELGDALDYYDQESQAECGLEDFAHLIDSWVEFISN